MIEIKKLIFFISLILLAVVTIGVVIYPIDNSRYTLNSDLSNQISSTMPNYTDIDKIPDDLKNAVIAVEDRRFYDHFGVDIIGIGRAILMNIKGGKLKEGGSTITQQLAKNLFLSNDKSLFRKLKEMILAAELERRFSKNEILEMYLNVVYFGNGAYGVENASREYFQKHVWKLDTAECAMLAGLPQAPSAYNPRSHFDRAKKRQESVLDAMVQYGYNHELIKKIQKEEVIITN